MAERIADKDRRALGHFQNAGGSFGSALQNVGASGGETPLAVPIGEQRAFLRDAIDIRGVVAHHPAVVGADIPVADVIAPDDEDVRLLGLGERTCRRNNESNGDNANKT